ncbi:MAG: MarC family protein [Polyangiaceae bacterium]
MNALSFGVLCFSSLFTVIDPIAVVPVFAALARGRGQREIRRIALRACLVAFGVLLVFAVSGAFLFRIFGITIDAFRIGGGLVFLMLGLPMLGGAHDAHASGDNNPETDGTDPSVVPLGMPLIGGPGAITTVIVLMGQSESAIHKTALFVALILALALTLLVLLVAPMLTRRIPKSGLTLITKLMGLIIVVIGVQFVIDGVRPVAVDILRSASA